MTTGPGVCTNVCAVIIYTSVRCLGTTRQCIAHYYPVLAFAAAIARIQHGSNCKRILRSRTDTVQAGSTMQWLETREQSDTNEKKLQMTPRHVFMRTRGCFF